VPVAQLITVCRGASAVGNPNVGEPGRLVLFIGTARPDEYVPLQRAGIRLGLVRDTSDLNAHPYPFGFHVVLELDFETDPEMVWAQVEMLSRDHSISCVLAPRDMHLKLASECASRLGLTALSPATVALVRDKSRMREQLAAELGTNFAVPYGAVRTLNDALQFSERHGFPLVLKPTSLYHSLYVTPCWTQHDLRKAFALLVEVVPGRQGAQEADALLHVEQFLTGSNHSVDCVALNGRVWPTPVVDVTTGVDLGGCDFHHFSRLVPSRLEAAEAEGIQSLAMRATLALGIMTGIAHVEMLQTPYGPRVIEVAGRMGGNRNRLLANGYGIDLIRAHIDVLGGSVPRLDALWEKPAAIAALYPIRGGILQRYHQIERVERLMSVSEVILTASPGQRVLSAAEGGVQAAMVELVAPTAQQLEADLDALAELRADIFEVAVVESESRP